MNLHTIRYIAEEVERQGRGPIQVAWMCEAWEYAMDWPDFKYPGLMSIKIMGHMVEPEKNGMETWRRVGVSVGIPRRICPAPSELDCLMKRWRETVPNMTPEEAYKEFEMIHPFVDGNGRVGKIIYNWIKGTLNDPAMPPNFFGGIP